MVDELKKQASEIYQERTHVESLPTSESLSIKRLVYIALAILVGLLAVIAALGGFQPRPDTIVQATTPPPIVKEEPPPELLSPPAAPPGVPASTAGPVEQVEKPTDSQIPSKPAPTSKPPEPEPRGASRPVRERPAHRPISEARPTAAAVDTRPEAPTPAKTETPKPEVSPVEIARQELAREIAVEKSPSLAKLLESQRSQFLGWKAEPDATDSYQVTFTFLGPRTGSQEQYIWRVNLSTREITPLSYYARKLP
jgi:hypothetical protein